MLPASQTIVFPNDDLSPIGPMRTKWVGCEKLSETMLKPDWIYKYIYIYIYISSFYASLVVSIPNPFFFIYQGPPLETDCHRLTSIIHRICKTPDQIDNRVDWYFCVIFMLNVRKYVKSIFFTLRRIWYALIDAQNTIRAGKWKYMKPQSQTQNQFSDVPSDQ